MNVEARPPMCWMRRVWPAVWTPPAYPYCRTAVAHHEAAHAVLFTLAGRRIGQAQISVVDGTEAHGIVTFADAPLRSAHTEAGPISVVPCWHPPFQSLAVSYAAAYMAGTFAEMLLHGVDAENGHYLLLDTEDWHAARRMLLVSFASIAPMFYCQRLARALLTENWAWVQAVAYELERHGTVDACTAARLGHPMGTSVRAGGVTFAGPPRGVV